MQLRIYRSLLQSSFNRATTTTTTSRRTETTPIVRTGMTEKEDEKKEKEKQKDKSPTDQNCVTDALLSLNKPQHSNDSIHNTNTKPPLSLFDGAVLGLDQLLSTAHTTGLLSSSSSYTSSISAFGFGGPLENVRLICQLDPCSVKEAMDDLRRLSDFLHRVEVVRSQSINPSCSSSSSTSPFRGSERSLLDMVVINTPPSVLTTTTNNYNHHHNTNNSSSCSMDTIEYLSQILPASAQFLESIPHRSIGYDTRLPHSTIHNAHGNPVRPHVRGVCHQFPDLDLECLTGIADVFPPTRFGLVTYPGNNLCSSSGSNGGGSDSGGGSVGWGVEEEEDRENDGNKGTVPRRSRGWGLSAELEGVVYGTDLLRTSPSTFHPSSSSSSDVGEHQGDETQNDNHGLFGEGTLFGEVWCAQEADGSSLSRVICDFDSCIGSTDTLRPLDCNGTEVGTFSNSNNKNNNSIDPVTNLASKIRNAFHSTSQWRANAKHRRADEEATAAAASSQRFRSMGIYGSDPYDRIEREYGTNVVVAAKALGLLEPEEEEENDDEEKGGNDGLWSEEQVMKRWRVLAFRYHPDTAEENKEEENDGTTVPFGELRGHYRTLMEAVRERRRQSMRRDEGKVGR